jgi:hypothetical protein
MNRRTRREVKRRRTKRGMTYRKRSDRRKRKAGKEGEGRGMKSVRRDREKEEIERSRIGERGELEKRYTVRIIM